MEQNYGTNTETEIEIDAKTPQNFTSEEMKQNCLNTPGIAKYLKFEVREDDQRSKIRRKLLSFMIGNATSEENFLRKAFMKKMYYLKKRWGHNTIIMTQFLNFMQAKVSEVWDQGREKIRRKINFLRNRDRGEKEAIPEELEGILISDEKLTERFEAPVIQPLTGGQAVTRGKEKAISLNPKETVRERVMRDKLAVASEVLADKIRWELRSREERDGADWTEDWEQEKVQKGIVFDEENTLMDHSKERVTNMPFCRRINILAPASKRNEIVIASMKQEIDAVTREFITEKCDSRGNQLDQGHDKEMRPGLISLTSRVKSGEILVQQTDKSGKLAITTREEYVASLQPHIASDKVITLEEKNETEKILNGHSIQLTCILRVGESHKLESRVKQAVTNKYCNVPILFGLLKDHKEVPPRAVPPVRPVCGADEANNSQLSQMLAGIVTAVTEITDKKFRSKCRSTEEMCHAIEEVNKRTDIKNLVLFSTDISAMYPSLDVPEVARVAAELWEESGLELNLNTEELSLYLAVTIKWGELEELGLGDMTHTRLKKGGASPGITTKEVISRQPSTKSMFRIQAFQSGHCGAPLP